jgi:hypothetical protein
MSSWYNIIITLNDNIENKLFNGYFNVDNTTNFIMSFLDSDYNNLLLFNTEHFCADFNYISDFSLSGFNINSLPGILNDINVYNIHSIKYPNAKIRYNIDNTEILLNIKYIISLCDKPDNIKENALLDISKLTIHQTQSLSPSSILKFTETELLSMTNLQLNVLTLVQKCAVKENIYYEKLSNIQQYIINYKDEISSYYIEINDDLEDGLDDKLIFSYVINVNNFTNIIEEFLYKDDNVLYYGEHNCNADYIFNNIDFENKSFSCNGVCIKTISDEFDKKYNPYYDNGKYAWKIYRDGIKLIFIAINTETGLHYILPKKYSIKCTDNNKFCFLEGTKILCNVNNLYIYIPIEYIKDNYLIKTYDNGDLPIAYIGYECFKNTKNTTRIINKLYIYTPELFPEVFEPLYLTGNHSILLDEINNNNFIFDYEHIAEINNFSINKENTKVDNKYSLPSYLNKDTHLVLEEKKYRVWNIALATNLKYKKHGIYANGILIESGRIIDLLNMKISH